MNKHTQKLEVFFDWILKSDLEGSSYFLDDILEKHLASFSDQKVLISFLNAEIHMSFIISILESNNDTNLIEHLIENVEFKIGRLESLVISDPYSFFPLLDEYKRIIPNWENIQYYYDRLLEVPVHLLNGEHKELVNSCPTELAPTIVDNLEKIFILNNDLSLEAYKSFIEKIAPEPLTLTESLDLDKLHFLIDKALLIPSLSNLQNMLMALDSQYDETLAKSIIDLIMIYDQQESDGTLDWKTLFWRDDEIIQDNSRTDFATLFFSLKSVSVELKKEALNEFLLSEWNTELGKILTIEESTLFDIYSHLESDDLRVNFLNNFFGTIVTKVSNIRKYFGLFDCSEFKKLSNENKKFPEVLALKEHELLFDKLIEYNIAQKTLRKAKDGYIVVRNNKLRDYCD